MVQMQDAFDRVCQQEKLEADDPARNRFATIIVKLASEGETDMATKAAALLKT